MAEVKNLHDFPVLSLSQNGNVLVLQGGHEQIEFENAVQAFREYIRALDIARLENPTT